jgi:RHS repeat-associated protein
MELGLLYYGARFYVPGLGRFASADTIVPNPTNPQSYNRYSYVRNNPLNMADPTGHYECDLETDNCGSGGGAITPPSPLPQMEKLWIPEGQITAIQLFGNTQFAHSLGDGWSSEKLPPNYGYSQGFHAGLDLFADAGTSVAAGISGKIVTISTNAFTPQYIEIEISPGIIMRIGHLTKGSTELEGLAVGQTVTANTIIGTVSSAQNHVHIEFEIGVSGSYQDYLVQPLAFMSDEMEATLLQIDEDPDRQNYIGTHFYGRSDGQWSTMHDQPVIHEYDYNLNVGQGNYEVPTNW